VENINLSLDLEPDFLGFLHAEVDPATKIEPELLWNKVQKYQFLFESLPFVKQIAVCNSLAFGVVDNKSDIDLLVILEPKRFFTSRFIMTALFQVFGIRRHAKKIAGRFCLSFFIADNKLDLNRFNLEQHDYYFYFWTRKLVFLFNNPVTVEDFKTANQVESDFLIKFGFKKNKLAKFIESILNMGCFDYLEAFMQKWQLSRARQKNALLGNPEGVFLEPGVLKFHVKDKRQELNKKFLTYLSVNNHLRK
jgi:hypothetical protein